MRVQNIFFHCCVIIHKVCDGTSVSGIEIDHTNTYIWWNSMSLVSISITTLERSGYKFRLDQSK